MANNMAYVLPYSRQKRRSSEHHLDKFSIGAQGILSCEL